MIFLGLRAPHSRVSSVPSGWLCSVLGPCRVAKIFRTFDTSVANIANFFLMAKAFAAEVLNNFIRSVITLNLRYTSKMSVKFSV